jgi:hypothetical protein
MKRKPECEHVSTTLTEDWEWVVCAKCGEPLRQNPDAPSIRVEHFMGMGR